MNAKLPKLELPVFSGLHTEWQPFWDQFSAIIDNSEELPDVVKFTYLRSLLKGEAKSVIAGLSLTGAHYKAAKTSLTKRYGRTERLIFEHINSLMNVTAPAKPTVKDLWALKDELDSHVQSLSSLDVTGEQYGVILTPLILARLPVEIRLEWAREEGHEDDLDYLLNFLSQEIERQERSQGYGGMRKQQPAIKTSQASSPVQGTATALQVVAVCGICGKDHSTSRCYRLTRTSVRNRRPVVKKARLCYACLESGHEVSSCSQVCSKCGGSHHAVLCRPPKEVHEEQGLNSRSGTGAVVEAHTNVTIESTQVIMQIAKVKVPHSDAVVNLFFDTGSDRTYVSTDALKSIRPQFVRAERLSYAAFGQHDRTQLSMRNVFSVQLQGIDAIETIEAFEVPVICAPLHRRAVPAELLKTIGVDDFLICNATDACVNVDVLIGLDYYWHLVNLDSRLICENLVAQSTKFGFMISGTYDGAVNAESTACMGYSLLTFDSFTEDSLKQCWELEAIGIADSGEKAVHDPVLEEFNQTVRYENGRYVVNLPWKKNHPPLINNYGIALRRLESLVFKLQKDPDLHSKYDAVISQMLNDGMVEEVPDHQMKQSGEQPVFYMPHRPVVREESTSTKIRPVFDASAPSYNGVSLNNCMETGPALQPHLVDVLLRFRRWPIAVCADITKAFLQIEVQSGDRDVHRFLWSDGGRVRCLRFTRVPFGNSCSPFLLNATIAHHLLMFDDSVAVRELATNMYVDDLITGADSEEAACELFEDARAVLSKASMVLTKLNTNSNRVYSTFEKLNVVVPADAPCKVLGMVWDPKEDVFGFCGVEVADDLVVTKRVILSVVSRLYDPFGFCGPFTMYAKILMQDTWMLNLGWDEDVPQELLNRFRRWVSDLHVVRAWTIPRCFVPFCWGDVVSKIELHAYGDASERGYGSVIYLRFFSVSFHVSLVMAKARVAPVKKVSLPRLELMAALLCARLAAHVMRALDLQDAKLFLYSDSQVALWWIKGSVSRWKTFVANRVSEIRSLSALSQWRFCPGIENPADALSRGVRAEYLLSSTWLHGPDWLSQQQDPPENNAMLHYGGEDDDALAEVKTTVLVTGRCDPVIRFDRFSKFSRLLRTVAWCYRFLSNCSSRKKQQGKLLPEEVSSARLQVLRWTQLEVFSREMADLEAKKEIRYSKVYKLRPFLEDGMLKVGSRLQFSDLSYEEKYPLLLPRGHVSLLLVRHFHFSMHHAGVKLLIVRVRSEYWILGLRQLAKRVVKECVICQRADARPCMQPTAPLPAERVQRAPPFSVVGLDHAGPLFCSDTLNVKHYILLFTCAVVRAVHLELVDSLSAETTVMAFRRFMARRGKPTCVFSDNARGFRAAAVSLQMDGVEWRFIAPLSPWWGGWWERLVRSTKSALRKTLGRRTLTWNQLHTVLVEVEACLNSRPLTFQAAGAKDYDVTTPAHFLIGRPFFVAVKEAEDACSVTRTDLVERMQHRNAVLERFWMEWRTEYLRLLPCPANNRSQYKLREGSVVLVEDAQLPRHHWPLAVVEKTHRGRDGRIRAVDLRTAKGLVTRSINRLRDLEIQ